MPEIGGIWNTQVASNAKFNAITVWSHSNSISNRASWLRTRCHCNFEICASRRGCDLGKQRRVLVQPQNQGEACFTQYTQNRLWLQVNMIQPVFSVFVFHGFLPAEAKIDYVLSRSGRLHEYRWKMALLRLRPMMNHCVVVKGHTRKTMTSKMSRTWWLANIRGGHRRLGGPKGQLIIHCSWGSLSTYWGNGASSLDRVPFWKTA